MKDCEKLRVFVSYSHEDRPLVKHVVRALRVMGVVPILDKNFAFGSGFHEQIKTYIAHSHVFMPIITASSMKRGWVHQEIGYASALNVPALPLSVNGALPGEMIGQLHAIKVEVPDLKSSNGRKSTARRTKHAIDRQMSGAFTLKDIKRLVRQANHLDQATFECAPLPEDRTANMVRYAETVADFQDSIPELAGTGFVRQLGALSSFHIPDAPLRHEVWKKRYGSQKRSVHHCRLQREERRALTRLASASGCRLIVNHLIDYGEYGEESRIVRLQSLLKFLESDEVNNVEVAFNTGMERAHSLTIVGDWYCAESVSARAGHGYDQTVFTRHAPSMHARIAAFDELFDDLLGDVKARDSRYVAIQTLHNRIRELQGTNFRDWNLGGAEAFQAMALIHGSVFCHL
ncbi:MAG: toll/interleukin-1 receptor domain-containing protein [Planctomycetaceae bacterium]|nr:toll/interleukin-1 receptor domain-containing protein [Planctomycetales bacterium]MCB9924246.1 toll/interleukin-1 receptor domain-containing protein [Planctomycetaceae bacterium]